jgi:choice-of-anchor C domain-containing protein
VVQKYVFIAALLILGLVWAPAGAQAALAENLLDNGGFETGFEPPTGEFRTLKASDDSFDDITGWLVSGSVDWKYTYWTAQEGDRSLDLSGAGIGAISTTFDTIPGEIYTVTFYLSGNFNHNDLDGNPLYKRVRVSAAEESQTFYFDRPEEWSTDNMGWIQQTFIFVAEDSSTLLTFASLDNNAFGPALDNVEVLGLAPPSDVPLPGTVWLLGSGLLGLLGWRSTTRT